MAVSYAEAKIEVERLVYELRPTGVPAGEAGVGYGLTEEEVAVVEGE